MEKEVRDEFSKVWNRLKELESMVSQKSQKSRSQNNSFESYSGLSGGINLLVDEGFFNSPRSIDEICEELKRNVYHYPKSSISKLLSVDFTKNNRILNRIKESKKWKYVIRK